MRLFDHWFCRFLSDLLSSENKTNEANPCLTEKQHDFLGFIQLRIERG